MQCSKQHLYSSNSSARRIAGPSNPAPCRHRHQVTVCFSSSQLDCGSQAFNQRCFVKRLAQKADRPAMERPIAVVLIWIGGNQNYWSAMSLRSQHLLQLKAVEAGHLQVGNQASRFRDHIRPKEMLGRAESNGLCPKDSTSSRIPSRASELSSTIEINVSSHLKIAPGLGYEGSRTSSSERKSPYSKYLIKLKKWVGGSGYQT